MNLLSQKIEVVGCKRIRTRHIRMMKSLGLSAFLWATTCAQTLSTLLIPVGHANVTQLHSYDLASGNTTLSRAILPLNNNSLICIPRTPNRLGLGTLTSDWASQTLYTTCSSVSNTSTEHSILSLKAPVKNFQPNAYPIAIANHIVLLLVAYSNRSFYSVTVPNDPRNQTTVLWSLDVHGYPRALTSADQDGWMLTDLQIHAGRLYALGNNGSVNAVLTWTNALPRVGEPPMPLIGTPMSSLIQAFTLTSADTLILLLSATSMSDGLSYPLLAQYRYASSSKQWFLNTQYLFQNRSHVPLKMTSQTPTNQFKFYGVTLQQVLEYTLGVTAGMTTHVETRVLTTAPKGFTLHQIAYLPGPTSVPQGWTPTRSVPNLTVPTSPQVRGPRLQAMDVSADTTMRVSSWSMSPLPTRPPQPNQQASSTTLTCTSTARAIATATARASASSILVVVPTPNPTPPPVESSATAPSGSGLRYTPIDSSVPPTVLVIEQSSHITEIIVGVVFGVLLSVSALGVGVYFLFILPAQKSAKLPTHQKHWKPPVPPKVRPMTQNPLIHHGIHPGVLAHVEDSRIQSTRLNESREERVKMLAQVPRHDTPTLQGQEEGNVPTMPLI